MTADAAQRSNIADVSPAELDELAVEKLAAAAMLLKQAPQPQRDFFNAFFKGAAPEDLARYTPQALVDLSAHLHSLTNTRKADQPLVLLSEFPDPSGNGRSETLLVAV